MSNARLLGDCREASTGQALYPLLIYIYVDPVTVAAEQGPSQHDRSFSLQLNEIADETSPEKMAALGEGENKWYRGSATYMRNASQQRLHDTVSRP